MAELTGSAGNDFLNGTDAEDSISGLGGDDQLRGFGGDDSLFGGAGIDILEGGDGNDALYGGQSSAATLLGGAGNDQLFGSAGNDLLDGGDGDDIIRDGANGDGGTDVMRGGTGNDTFWPGTGAATIDGGAGDDVVWLENLQPGVFDLSLPILGQLTLTSVEGLQGTSGDDVLLGTEDANWLDGSLGNDRLEGFGGNDRLVAQFGSDALFGGAGDDLLSLETSGSSASATLDGGEGDDTVTTEGERQVVGSYPFDVVIVRGAQIDLAAGSFRLPSATATLASIENATGSLGDDVLVGDAGINRLDGAAGDDRISGGAGDDSLIGGDGVDWLLASAGAAGITADLSLTTVADGLGGTDTITGFEALGGTTGDDVLLGDAANNWFEPGIGIDRVDGRGGFDVAEIDDIGRQGLTVTFAEATLSVTAGNGTDQFTGVEAIRLADSWLLQDPSGNAAATFQLYSRLFQRDADPGGLAYWTAQRDAGLGFDAVIDFFARTDEFYHAYDSYQYFNGFQQDWRMTAGSIEALYQSLLGRQADAEGLSYWLSVLGPDGFSEGRQAEVVKGLAGSAEFLAGIEQPVEGWSMLDRPYIAALARLYDTAFDRLPDSAGFSAVLKSLEAGSGLVAAAGTLIGSAEFDALFGPLDDRSFVSQLYRNALGREADAGGLDYWADQVLQTSRDQVALALSESAEHVQSYADLLEGGVTFA
jgi:Ca2+-binding RTX toxin-like protein